MSRRARAAVAAILFAAALSQIATTWAEIRPLTLYQRVGRSPWIMIGEVTDANDRFAEVKVVEVLKGAYEKPAIRIIFRLGNFMRQSWEEKLEFAQGERDVLFLKRYESDRDDGKLDEKLKAEDLFAPTFGAQGRFTLPEEGQPAYIEALREFVKVSGMPDPAAQEDALLAWLQSSNPHVLQAGLEEVLERRLAADAQVPTLMRLSESPRDPVRLNALQVLEQVARDLRSAKRVLPDQADIVNAIKGKVIGEGGDAFRAEAVKVVAALAGEQESAFLERISKEDSSQLVRYEAGRALLELKARP